MDGSYYQKIPPDALSDPQGRERLPQTLEDDAFSTLNIVEVAFANSQHLGAYMSQLPSRKKRISKETLASAWGYFEITISICMYELVYSILFLGFVRDIFRYYRLGFRQLYFSR